MATPKLDPALLEIIQIEAKKAAQDVYAVQGTQYNVAAVPTHTHNGVDSLNFPALNLSGFYALPSTPGGVVSPGLLGNQGVAQGSTNIGYGYQATGAQATFPVFPVPIIYGHGVGVDSQFNGGSAPEGSIVIFDNPGSVHQIWWRSGGDWWGADSTVGPA